MPINWNLISNPFNWVVILLMVIIGGIAIQLISSQLPSVSASPANN
jgi:hypothetical protein